MQSLSDRFHFQTNQNQCQPRNPSVAGFVGFDSNLDSNGVPTKCYVRLAACRRVRIAQYFGAMKYLPRQGSFCLLLMAVLLSACAGLYPRPDPPNVTLAGLRVVEMGLFEQRYRLRLRIQNPNAFALPIRGMDYELTLNDREFARGVSRQYVTVPAFGEEVLEVDVISNLGELIEQLQDLGAGRVYTLSYGLSGGISLANRAIKIPFDYQGEIALTPPEHRY